MTASSIQLDNLDDLRSYVYAQLCEQNELELGAFPIVERILVRGCQPCGILFCLHGPRSTRMTAIWETDRNTILFYNTSGQRIRKVRLVQAPVLVPAGT